MFQRAHFVLLPSKFNSARARVTTSAARALKRGWPLSLVVQMFEDCKLSKSSHGRDSARPQRALLDKLWCVLQWARYQSVTSQWLQLPTPEPSRSATSTTASSSSSGGGNGQGPGVPQLPGHQEAKLDDSCERGSRGGGQQVQPCGPTPEGRRERPQELVPLRHVRTAAIMTGRPLEEQPASASTTQTKKAPQPGPSLSQRVLEEQQKEKDRTIELSKETFFSNLLRPSARRRT